MDLEALRSCVHCGLCLPHCPTYQLLGQEMDSPRGRLYLMRAVEEERIELTPTVDLHLDRCLGCRACESACPSAVPFGHLLESARAESIQRGRGDRFWTRLLLSLFTNPKLFALLMPLLRAYQRSGLARFLRKSRILSRFPRLAALEAMLPDAPRFTPRQSTAPERSRGVVGLFLGCVERELFPSIHREAERLLTMAGYRVVVPEQGCCGALHAHAGEADAARELGERLARAFAESVDYVAVSSAGCGARMKELSFGDRVRDVSELLAGADLPLRPMEMIVAYHPPCHLLHGMKLRAEPRQMLERIPGARIIDLADEGCCGSAGLYGVLEPALGDALLEKKMEAARAKHFDVIATGNPGCMLQLARGCRSEGRDIEVLHPIELLGRAVASSE